MKRIKGLILIFVILLFPISVRADDGGFNLSSGTTSLQKGGTGSITITTYNSAGKLLVTSSDPGVVSVGVGAIFVDGSDNFSITANGAGTATITVTGSSEYAQYTPMVTLEGFSRSILVTVTDPNANNNNNNNGGGSGGLIPVQPSNNNNNNNSNNNNSNNDNNKQEDKKEEKKSDNSKIKTLTVDDYNLKKINDNKYELTVDNKVNMVNIKAVAADSKATVKGNGVHELTVGENKIEIVITAEDGSKNTITIIVTREEENVEVEPTTTIGTTDSEPENKINIISIIMIGLNIVLGIAVITLFIKNKKLKDSLIINK